MYLASFNNNVGFKHISNSLSDFDLIYIYIKFDELSYFLYNYNIYDMLEPEIRKHLEEISSFKESLYRVGDHNYVMVIQYLPSINIDSLAQKIKNIFLEPICIDNQLLYLMLSLVIDISKKTNYIYIL